MQTEPHQPKDGPFAQHNHSIFFDGASYGKVLNQLISSIRDDGPGLIIVEGENGVGRSHLASKFASMVSRNDVEILRIDPKTSNGNILTHVSAGLGVDIEGADRKRVKQRLAATVAALDRGNRRAIVVVDNADTLSKPDLAQLSDLLPVLVTSGRRRVHMYLFGNEDTTKIIAVKSSDPSEERTIASFRLRPMQLNETAAYIKFRMNEHAWPMPPETPQLFAHIYKKSKGIPKQINIICADLLLRGRPKGLNSGASSDNEGSPHAVRREEGQSSPSVIGQLLNRGESVSSGSHEEDSDDQTINNRAVHDAEVVPGSPIDRDSESRPASPGGALPQATVGLVGIPLEPEHTSRSSPTSLLSRAVSWMTVDPVRVGVLSLGFILLALWCVNAISLMNGGDLARWFGSDFFSLFLLLVPPFLATYALSEGIGRFSVYLIPIVGGSLIFYLVSNEPFLRSLMPDALGLTEDSVIVTSSTVLLATVITTAFIVAYLTAARRENGNRTEIVVFSLFTALSIGANLLLIGQAEFVFEIDQRLFVAMHPFLRDVSRSALVSYALDIRSLIILIGLGLVAIYCLVRSLRAKVGWRKGVQITRGLREFSREVDRRIDAIVPSDISDNEIAQSIIGSGVGLLQGIWWGTSNAIWVVYIPLWILGWLVVELFQFVLSVGRFVLAFFVKRHRIIVLLLLSLMLFSLEAFSSIAPSLSSVMIELLSTPMRLVSRPMSIVVGVVLVVLPVLCLYEIVRLVFGGVRWRAYWRVTSAFAAVVAVSMSATILLFLWGLVDEGIARSYPDPWLPVTILLICSLPLIYLFRDKLLWGIGLGGRPNINEVRGS